MICRQAFMCAYASRSVIRWYFIRYAIQMLADLLTPAAQWTRVRPPRSRAILTRSAHRSKYKPMRALGRSSTLIFIVSTSGTRISGTSIVQLMTSVMPARRSRSAVTAVAELIYSSSVIFTSCENITTCKTFAVIPETLKRSSSTKSMSAFIMLWTLLVNFCLYDNVAV